MITQIEIDGFKTFKDFKVELAPFQVIVGPNGSGKSNLFDALHLLSRLAEMDLRSAFQEVRGEAGELFTKLPNGKSVDRMMMAVEILVDRKVSDDLGEEAELKYTRLRYELEITSRSDEYGLEQLYVYHESLKSIPQEQDSWCNRYGLSSENKWVPFANNDIVSFISTTPSRPRGRIAEAAVPYNSSESLPVPTRDANTINLLQDGQRPGKISNADKVKRTVLSSVTDIGFPHAFAVREEMRSWQLMHLNHEALREPASTNTPRSLSLNRSNLPTTLVRMQAEDRFALNDVSLDMANLVPELTRIELKRDEARDEYTIWAQFQDGRSFSSRVLSDGILQLLVLVTLKNDAPFHGVLCFEEPENGIHPTYLKDIAHLLRGLTTDFNDPQQINEALKQVLVTTHSSTFISQPEVIDALLFTYTMTRVEPQSHGIPPIRVTYATPVLLQDASSRFTNVANESVDKEVVHFTLDQVKSLLADNSLDEALERLNQSRIIIEENL